jgi:hypothetical protein
MWTSPLRRSPPLYPDTRDPVPPPPPLSLSLSLSVVGEVRALVSGAEASGSRK